MESNLVKLSSKLLMSCMFICAFNASSAEEGRYYLGLGLGKSNGYIPHTGEMPSGRYDEASVYSFSIGRQFDGNIAADFEVSSRGDYTNNDHSYKTKMGTYQTNVSVSSLSAMLNGYYYYDKFTSFKPYLTAGAGLSQNKTSNLVVTGDDINNEPFSMVTDGGKATSFAWKVGAGTKYILDSHFEADFRYQYVNLGEVKTGNLESTNSNGAYVGSEYISPSYSKLRAHEFLIGIVYKF